MCIYSIISYVFNMWDGFPFHRRNFSLKRLVSSLEALPLQFDQFAGTANNLSGSSRQMAETNRRVPDAAEELRAAAKKLSRGLSRFTCRQEPAMQGHSMQRGLSCSMEVFLLRIMCGLSRRNGALCAVQEPARDIWQPFVRSNGASGN